jgi:hypothetical protein
MFATVSVVYKIPLGRFASVISDVDTAVFLSFLDDLA